MNEMNEVRFETVIGEDRVIRLPDGVAIQPGRVEVVIAPAGPPATDPAWPLVEQLARAAEELGIAELPPDLAEDHDHYAHGAPRGIDRR